MDVVFLMIVTVNTLQTIKYIVADSDTRTIHNGGRLHPVSGCSTAATNLLWYLGHQEHNIHWKVTREQDGMEYTV